MKWKKGAFLSEGKGKTLYEVVDHPSLIWMEFKDSLTAFNGQKKSSFKDKGKINRDMSSLVFQYLKKNKVQSHWIENTGEKGMICQRLKITPLEVVVRNRLSGSTARKFSFADGTSLPQPLVEFYYKNDELKDPFISTDQALAFGFVSQEKDIIFLKKQALLINQTMKVFFDSAGLELIDFKLEFGTPQNTGDSKKASLLKNTEQKIFILGDEFSCDTCRLWDKKTKEKQDKDRFRLNLGEVETAYKKVLKAIT